MLKAEDVSPATRMACREGRQLIYDLSAKHRSSLLLNYAMQKILRAGHEEEVGAMPQGLNRGKMSVHAQP